MIQLFNNFKIRWFQLTLVFSLILLGLMLLGWSNFNSVVFAETQGIYQEHSVHHPDGIGKFYLGREIAKVMGHEGAAWLERPSRRWEERPAKLIDSLEIKSTDIIADIGCGTGYLSFRIASLVPEGKVLAVDIQPEMLEIIEILKQKNNIENVEPVLGKIDHPNLPTESVDLALMVDAYHEFEYPKEMMEGIVKSLKPGGRVMLVEYRGENPFIPIKGLHKMTENQVKKEMSVVGITWQATKEVLPQQHILIFEKPVD